MIYQLLAPIRLLRERRAISERSLSALAGISRSCLRKISTDSKSLTVQSIVTVAAYLGCKVQLLLVPAGDVLSDYSTSAVSLKVERDGFDSWKIHFMDLVDEFRRTLDPRLIILPPHRQLDTRLTSMLASIVRELCLEANLEVPDWAAKRYFLESPWFVSGMESLKAAAIVESPISFRSNNIFVHENFLERA